MTRFSCTSCGAMITASGNKVDSVVKCLNCGATTNVPGWSHGSSEQSSHLSDTDPGLSTESQEKSFLTKVESLVRDFGAQYSRSSNLITYPTAFQPALISKLRENFAREMGDNESPLLLLDRSSWGQGKSGLLITDHKLYSSHIGQAIPLASIQTVSVEKMTEATGITDVSFSALLVNGLPAIKGGRRKTMESLETLIRALAEQAQDFLTATQGPKQPVSSASFLAQTEDGFAKIAASSVCSKRPADEIVASAIRLGLNEARAMEIIRKMETEYALSRGRAWTSLLAGTFLLCVGVGTSTAGLLLHGPYYKFTTVSRIIFHVFQLLGVVGLLSAWRGVKRLVKPSVRAEDILTVWQASERS